MTQQQIAWAKSHDWFIKDLGNGKVIVRNHYTVRTEHGAIVSFIDEIIFTDFRSLRDWAGY